MICKIITIPEYTYAPGTGMPVLSFKATYAASYNTVQTYIVYLSGNLADVKRGKLSDGDHIRVRGGASVEDGMLVIDTYKIILLHQ